MNAKGVIIMTLSKKLRQLRMDAHLSQEALASKLNVSRQAVTKWETDKGVPDLSNLIALSALFNITIDELVSDINVKVDHVFTSTTSYGLSDDKRIDMNLGGAASIELETSDSEDMIITLISKTIDTLSKDVKVKIDDSERSLDIKINRSHNMTEKRLKDHLTIRIDLPAQYVKDLELYAHINELKLANIHCEHIEFDGRMDNSMQRQP